MAKPIKFDESSDNEDLQSLFDSIAAGSEVPMHATKPPEPAVDASGDSDDLQALFDSVASQVEESAAAPAPASSAERAGAEDPAGVFSSLGQMTRELHDSLRDIGHDKVLGEAARSIPDARQRLSYIVQMTEQAASRALSAIEIAKPIQDAMQARSEALGLRWGKVFANQLSAEDFKVLAADTQAFLNDIPKQTRATNEQLTEIMMAQDFQDLTGQVIKKVVDLVENLERQLLSVLLEAMPPEMNIEAPEGLLNGPVIDASGRKDVVTSQSQVDDLLESLGF
jgi:chemotaxis protein CheZ